MHGGHAALVLFERAHDAIPAEPELDVPLAHPGLLTRFANTLGCLLR